MTKFYFFGGGLFSHLDKTDFLKRLKAKYDFSNILLIPYAKDERDWKGLYESFSSAISRQNLNIQTHLATMKLEDFIEGLNKSKVLIFCGGNELSLKSRLESIGISIKDIIKDKIVLGNSAGTNIFTNIYFSNDRQKVEGGLGICPIKTICHYDETKKGCVKALKDVGDNLPIFTLRNEQFMEYEV